MGLLLLVLKRVSLSSDDNPEEIVSVDGVDYGVELFSASDNNAIIKVNKCGSGELEEYGDVVSEIPETNEIVNDSIGVVNDSVVNDTSDLEINDSVNESVIVDGDEESDDFIPDKLYYYILGGVVPVILIILFFLVRLLRNRKI